MYKSYLSTFECMLLSQRKTFECLLYDIRRLYAFKIQTYGKHSYVI